VTSQALRISVLCLVAAGTSLIAQPAASTYLKTSIDPGRAGVFVDGKYVGPAGNFGIARKYPLPPGSHQLKFVDPRYEEFSTTVDVKEGKTTKVEQKLKELPKPKGPFGGLRTVVPEKYAPVYINDHYYGHAGEFNNPTQKLMLPVGDYDVRVEPSSGSPKTQRIKIEADKTVIVK
jgi:PEGA domain